MIRICWIHSANLIESCSYHPCELIRRGYKDEFGSFMATDVQWLWHTFTPGAFPGATLSCLASSFWDSGNPKRIATAQTDCAGRRTECFASVCHRADKLRHDLDSSKTQSSIRLEQHRLCIMAGTCSVTEGEYKQTPREGGNLFLPRHFMFMFTPD